MFLEVLSFRRVTDGFLALDLSCIVKVGVSGLREISFEVTFKGLFIRIVLLIGVLNSYFLGVIISDYNLTGVFNFGVVFFIVFD